MKCHQIKTTASPRLVYVKTSDVYVCRIYQPDLLSATTALMMSCGSARKSAYFPPVVAFPSSIGAPKPLQLRLAAALAPDHNPHRFGVSLETPERVVCSLLPYNTHQTGCSLAASVCPSSIGCSCPPRLRSRCCTAFQGSIRAPPQPCCFSKKIQQQQQLRFCSRLPGYTRYLSAGRARPPRVLIQPARL